MKARYIFIALFTAFIMIDVISLFFYTVKIHDSMPSPFGDDDSGDSFYSVISMFSSASSDDMFTGLFYCSVILGPIFALITAGTMKAPMKIVWKVLFIIYLLINLIHSFLAFFVMVFDIFGPAKYLTVAGWIPIGLNFLSAVFLFVIAVGKPVAAGVLKQRIING